MNRHREAEDVMTQGVAASYADTFSRGHFVQFYEEEGFLVDSVAAFIGAGLGAGEGAVVIATAAHRRALAEQLTAQGIDLFTVEKRGQYVALDAAETLSAFMADASPDEHQFRSVVGDLIKHTRQGRRGLRAFGEMVALLWKDGNGAAAIRLEELWNDLAKSHSFSLFCAYPINEFADADTSKEFDRICRAHSHVRPSESYYFRSDEGRTREFAVLQQRALALEAEIARRKEAEEKLGRREAELTDFVESASIGLHWVGSDGIIQWANKAEFQMLGYTAEEYIGRHIAEFHADQNVIGDILARLKHGERLCDYEARLRCKDGSIKTVAIDSSVLRENGKFIHTQCFTRDITGRRQTEDLLRERQAWLGGQREALEGALGDAPLEKSLGKLVSTAIERWGEGVRAAFYLADPKGTTLHHVVGMGADYAEAVDGLEIGAKSLACGLATHTGQAVITCDVRQDPRWKPWLRLAEKFDFRGCWSFPIRTEAGSFVGTFAVYWREPRAASQQEREFAELVTQTAAIVVSRKRAEEELRKSEASLQTELADSKLLQAISLEIVLEPQMATLYEKLTDAAVAIMKSDFASLQMFCPECRNGELQLRTSRGFAPEAAKTWEWVSRESPSSCGEALRKQCRVIATDVEQCDFLGSEGLAAYRSAGICAMQSTPLFSRDGKLVGMISTHWRRPHQTTERELRLFDILARQAADVIERRRAEMKLRESEERYRRLVSLMPTAVYCCDAEGRITFYNRRAAELWGREPEANASERFCACYKVIAADGSYVPPHERPMAIAVREGKSFRNVEALVERPDGSTFVAAVNIDPIWDAEGKIQGAINVSQDITERKQAEENLRKRGERLQLLSETLGQLLSARDPDTIVRGLFPKVAAHLGVDTYFNFMVNEAGDALRLHSCAGIPEETARGIERLEFGQAICGTVAQTRAPIHATHIQESDYDKAALVRSFGLQCYACNPLMVGNRLLGTLSFASRTRLAFDEDDLQFVRMISQYVAVALDRLQSAQTLLESQRQLAVDADALAKLNTVGSRLWQGQSLSQGIKEMLDATIEMLGADFGNIQLLQGGTLRIVAQRGFEREFLDFFREVSAQDESACGRALRTGERILIKDVDADEGYAPMRVIARSAGYRAVQSTPLIGRKGKAIGMISTHWRFPHTFEKQQLHHLDLYVRQAADFIERCEIEQALRESEERFRAVLDNSTTVIYVKDCDGKHLLVNECFRRLFHLSEKEILGKTDFDVFPAEVAQIFRENDLKVIRTGKPLEVEEIAPHKNGPHNYFSVKFPLRRDDGSIYAVAGISTDITDRKRAQETRAMLAAIVEHSDDAIFSTDLERVIRSWNRAAERLYGYTADEAIGQPIGMIIPEGRECEDREILQRVREGQTLKNHETIRLRKDGTLFHVSLTVSPVKDSYGTVVGISKVARDITDKVHARENLEQTVAERTASLREAVEQMEEFSYSVSHDLRAPLRAMMAYAGVLLEEYSARLDDTARDYLEKIQRSADRMNRLTQDVLTYSRVARAQIQLEPISLETLVKDIVHQYSFLQPPAVDIQIASPLLDILGHETTFGQSVANLLNNAVKFIAPGIKPRVRISTERQGKNVRVWFEDNGIGIKPQHQERVFQMFERVHPDGKYEGTGIGLTIVRKAVEKMGGKVGVESDGQSGSRFWIELRGAE
jgi:PAS domain S-box-containing protein